MIFIRFHLGFRLRLILEIFFFNSCFCLFFTAPFLEYEREMSSIRSQFDYEDAVGSSHKEATTEVYPDHPNSNVSVASKTSDHKNKSPLVWGEDITFLDRRQRENGSDETEAGTQYISLNGFSFFPKDEETEDLNDICSSLELVDQSLVETHPCTVEEIYQSTVETHLAQENPPVTGRVGLRRTRNASQRVSLVLSEDDNSFCSQSENVNKSSRKRHMSSQSVMSGGSYDDADDSPCHNNNGRKKRRRYEENPSEDPAFEKSRKNAIIAKRNREKKKALMDEMEKQCHKLTKDNTHLESDNGKLRHRVTTLEEEVYYLKSVLANDSSLSTVLSGLKSIGNLRFTTNLDPSKYSKKPVGSSSTGQQKTLGGVCVHLDRHQRISVEKCSECSINRNIDACLGKIVKR